MKYIPCILLLSAALLASCSDDSTSDNNNNTSTGTYMPLTQGNWWIYKDAQGDTVKRTVSGSFAFSGSTYSTLTDKNQIIYIRQSGALYYGLFPDAQGLTLHEVKIADPTANTTWKDSISGNGFDLVSSYKSMGTGFSSTVNGKTYSDVMRIHVDVTSFGSTSGSDFYFAKGVGQILEMSGTDTIESLMTYNVQ